MIRLAKFSLIIFVFFTSSSLTQSLKGFEVSGNFDFDDSEYFQWSGLRFSQPIFTGILDSAKSRIAFNLNIRGYYFSHFNEAKLDISQDSTSATIFITIDEGKSAVIKNIYFNGIDSLLGKKIIDQFEFLKGQAINKEVIEINIGNVLSEYENSGYPFIKIIINSVYIYHDSVSGENFADIYFKIGSGELNRIDKIEIRGNNSTKDYVIIRELRLEKGEVYSQERIEEFPNRLNRLRFFESVKVPQFYLNSKNEGVLLVEIKEKNTNNFDGIIGYVPPNKNEQSGFVTGLVNISLRNLFGTGRAAAIRWNKFDRNSQEFDLKYLEPWLLGYPFNINFNFYQRIQDTTYVQRKIEGAVEYLATEDISASVMIASESVIPTVRIIPRFTVFNSTYFTTGINLKIDTRDDPYAPTTGILFINSYAFSKKTIDGPLQHITPDIQTEVNLQRFAVSLYAYYEIFLRQIIAIGINGRELRGPTFENSDLYRLGGTNSLRGYRENQFLGSRIFWSNLEYRFLFTRRSYGFIFFDTGYFLRPAEETRNILKAEDFLYGFGLGLSLETGLGVLAVSYALGKGDSFSDGKIHFGIINKF